MASKVHKVRYYNPKPQPINCISYNKTNKQIAVARGDASIEIWDLKHAPYLIKFIPGVDKGSVEALGWVKDRLLSTGLGGALIEWNLDTLTLKTTVLLTGYAAWCLDVNSDNTLVAIGTEQGYVNLFSVEHDQIIYKKLFDKQEGRILCCKFNKEGNILVTGSINTIRVWNAETGHAITRMCVLRKKKQIIVWCLAILSDNTVVSGDSQGKLIFWDSKIGDQIESYSTHKADVLSIAVSDDEKSIFCSGVDPVIMNFIKVNKSTEKQTEAHWVKNVQRNIHEHDVRGLVVDGDKLISVGVDGYLTFSSYPPKWVMRLPPMIPGPRSSISRRKKLLLLRYSNHLEVWKLGSYATNNDGNVLITNVITTQDVTCTENKAIEEDSTIDVINRTNAENTHKQSLKLTEKPVKLASIQTKGKKQLRCCELSPSGEIVVYATATDVRMLKLETDEDQSNISLSKVSISGIPKAGCDRVAFTEDSSILVAHCEGILHVLQVDPEAGATPVQVISLDKYLKSKSILHLHVSPKSPTGVTYLVVADTQSNVAVWTQSNKKFEFHVSLPTYHCVPSALTVDALRENLIIAYVDQKLVEYELRERRFSPWPGGALPAGWGSRRAAARALLPHPARHALVCQDDTSLWVLENTNKEPFEPAAKRKSMSESKNIAFKIIPIKYLADFHWLDKDEAVTIEILPESIVAQLPPIAATKRHG
ncbi:U3 small nucleolar RNA-associated protein 4 homolog [Trichoplusia ni]|uniref:U3 small nucleolar RNA-associated protein 4 homolog n=1 Tax=Trichoplusia ni TaxID=7111 RepID=A0A7E5WD50_TRINI|nr:U3 small nucleolar RNA-associated protein 4 homolog [Trichoplusia ni]